MEDQLAGLALQLPRGIRQRRHVDRLRLAADSQFDPHHFALLDRIGHHPTADGIGVILAARHFRGNRHLALAGSLVIHHHHVAFQQAVSLFKIGRIVQRETLLSGIAADRIDHQHVHRRSAVDKARHLLDFGLLITSARHGQQSRACHHHYFFHLSFF